MRINVQDCRAYSPRAVEIANLLDSNKPDDYRKVDDWLKANPDCAQYDTMTLVEVFDREVGLSNPASEEQAGTPAQGERRVRP